MKNFSLKALGAFIFAAGLVVAGVAGAVAPASATNGAAPTNIVNPGTSTSTAAMTVFWDAVPAGNTQTVLRGTGGVTFTSIVQPVTVTGTQAFQDCTTGIRVRVDATTASANRSITCGRSSGSATFSGLQPGDVIIAEFASGSMTFAASGTWSVYATYDQFGAPGASISLTNPNAVVSYNAAFAGNGGTGNSPTPMSSSSGSITLPANTYTKAGFTFAGWRAGSATVGTVYQAATSAPLTANTTFYAQWSDNSATPAADTSNTLANTGINSATGISLLAGGLSLALIGAEMFMIARRKRSN